MMKPSLLDILQQERQAPEFASGRGVVIRGGSESRMVNAWMAGRFLRHFGCGLPIEVWLSSEPVSERWAAAFESIEVTVRRVGGEPAGDVEWPFAMPMFALLQSNFDEVLYLDSFTVPVQDVEALFDSPQFEESGAVFWPGSGSLHKDIPLWAELDLDSCLGRFDSGQCLLRLSSVWEPLMFSGTIHERIFRDYKYLHKNEPVNDAVFLALQKFGTPFEMPKIQPDLLKFPGIAACKPNVVVQHDFEKNPLFQRRIHPRRQLIHNDSWVPGLLFEATYREFLRALRGMLDAGSPRPSCAVKSELIEGQWMLTGWGGFMDHRDLPMISQGTSGYDPLSVKPESKAEPQKVKKVVVKGREIHFAADGTFGLWTDTELSSWSVVDVDGVQTMELRAADRVMASLVRVSDGTGVSLPRCGTAVPAVGTTGVPPVAAAGGTPTGPTSETHVLRRFDGTLDGTWCGAGKVRGKKKELVLRKFDAIASQVVLAESLTVKNSSTRLGDHVSALYALCGVANAGVHVRFQTPFASWFAGVEHPGLTIGDDVALEDDVVDVNQFKGQERRLGASQAKTYAGILGANVVPRRPNIVSSTIGALNWKNAVLLFPFDAAVGLEWSSVQWQRLIVLLRNAGYEVIGIGTSKNAERIETMFSPLAAFWVIDPEIDWLLNSMCNSTGVIATANGGAHLAGLHGVPCVSIQSHLPADYLWDFAPSVQAVVPNTGCTGCRWNLDRGYDPVCELGCSALHSVSPEAVLARFIEITKAP